MRPMPTDFSRLASRSTGRHWHAGLAWAMIVVMVLTGGLTGCESSPAVPRPKGYFRIALHDTLYRDIALDCPVDLPMSGAALLEPVRDFAPDSCWVNLVYPSYAARIHCTYAGGVDLTPVVEDAFRLAYEHEIKADAIEVRQRQYDGGGMAMTWRISGDAASPLQFLRTDGQNRFLRGALYFELRPNADSLAPVVARIEADVDHLLNAMAWR